MCGCFPLFVADVKRTAELLLHFKSPKEIRDHANEVLGRTSSGNLVRQFSAGSTEADDGCEDKEGGEAAAPAPVRGLSPLDDSTCWLPKAAHTTAAPVAANLIGRHPRQMRRVCVCGQAPESA